MHMRSKSSHITVTSGPGVPSECGWVRKYMCVAQHEHYHTSSHERGDTGPQLRPGDTAGHSTSRTNREALSGLRGWEVLRTTCPLVRVGKRYSSLWTNRELTRRKRAGEVQIKFRRSTGVPPTTCTCCDVDVRRGRAAPCVLCISW